MAEQQTHGSVKAAAIGLRRCKSYSTHSKKNKPM